MNGTEISFVAKRSYLPPNVNRIEYTGKINGDEISFTRKFFGAVSKADSGVDSTFRGQAREGVNRVIEACL